MQLKPSLLLSSFFAAIVAMTPSRVIGHAAMILSATLATP